MPDEPAAPEQAGLPPGVPAEALPFLKRTGYLEPDRLSVGDPAPDVSVFTLDGSQTGLSDHWRERQLILVFGSYT